MALTMQDNRSGQILEKMTADEICSTSQGLRCHGSRGTSSRTERDVDKTCLEAGEFQIQRRKDELDCFCFYAFESFCFSFACGREVEGRDKHVTWSPREVREYIY